MSAQDIEWWLREALQARNYTTWFQPGVSVIDADWGVVDQPAPPPPPTRTASGSPAAAAAARVIQHGDMLHVDFGVTAMGLNTDTQHLAYVLRPGETEADVPAGLAEGLRRGNRMQDIVRSRMEVGATGNEVLARSLAQMEREGIRGMVYSHAIGDWGHSAGTTIGESVWSPRRFSHRVLFVCAQESVDG